MSPIKRKLLTLEKSLKDRANNDFVFPKLESEYDAIVKSFSDNDLELLLKYFSLDSLQDKVVSKYLKNDADRLTYERIKSKKQNKPIDNPDLLSHIDKIKQHHRENENTILTLYDAGEYDKLLGDSF
jgi:hypothetical protein